jgi:hypothetical protein
MRVFIHLGFHKTGTTSAQALLRENRKLLRRHLYFYLKWRFEDVTFASRGFSTWRDPLTREKFRWRWDAFLQDLTLDPGKPLLLSSEELTGHLPGRQGLADYSAAPLLAADMAKGVFSRWGGDTELTFIYTTRDPDSWLRSAYNHHIARTDLALDWQAYRDQFAASADFAPIIAQTAELVPNAQVLTRALEDSVKTRLGPGSALIEPIGLPDAVVNALDPVSQRNPALTAEQIAYCLRLNRSAMPDEERLRLKTALIDQTIETAAMDKPSATD